jgi:hypothetical protein
MLRDRLTALIYALAALAACILWLVMSQSGYALHPAVPYLLLFLGPLLFAFAYPTSLFASDHNDAITAAARMRSAALLHGTGLAITTITFVVLGSKYWGNPLRGLRSVSFLATAIAVDLLFLAAAVLLLTRANATLPRFASHLLWPYWLVLALVFTECFFDATSARAALGFLYLTVSLVLAFAGGTVRYRPTIAAVAALSAVIAEPWVCSNVAKDTPLGNVWTSFNIPDPDRFMGEGFFLLIISIVLSATLIALAVATAAIRLTPSRWRILGTPFRDRTWPAVLLVFAFVAVWFSQSVMPYRISGAMDYSAWPLLKILHVQKQGLQFHEVSVGLWGFRQEPDSVSFSSNDRRLFHYRFQETGSHTELPGSFQQRVHVVLDSLRGTPGNRETLRPIRDWNADRWYLTGENIGLREYSDESLPPTEIVALFHDLENLPRSREFVSESRDVCLGFCYDPLAGLGRLFANHRCTYDATRRDYVCR